MAREFRGDACSPPRVCSQWNLSQASLGTGNTPQTTPIRTQRYEVFRRVIPPLNYSRSFSPRRGRLRTAHGNATGLARYKTVSPAGAPYDDATIEIGPGRLGGPFRADSFLGLVVPWRCHGLRVKCPSRGGRFCAGRHMFSAQCGTIRVPTAQTTSNPWQRPKDNRVV